MQLFQRKVWKHTHIILYTEPFQIVLWFLLQGLETTLWRWCCCATLTWIMFHFGLTLVVTSAKLPFCSTTESSRLSYRTLLTRSMRTLSNRPISWSKMMRLILVWTQLELPLRQCTPTASYSPELLQGGGGGGGWCVLLCKGNIFMVCHYTCIVIWIVIWCTCHSCRAQCSITNLRVKLWFTVSVVSLVCLCACVPCIILHNKSKPCWFHEKKV